LRRARGNRGELIAEIDSSEPGRADRLVYVCLKKGALSRAVRVERVWRHSGRLILKFEGIDSIAEAETWAGAEILVAAAERALPAQGEFSHAELIGCTVLREDTDEEIGVVRDIEEYGGPPLLNIETPEGGEVLVPFARSICREIDPARKLIRAWLPEGLVEINHPSQPLPSRDREGADS
jgi:16S rRNA processing protein RimM